MNQKGRPVFRGMPWLLSALLALSPLAWAGDYSSEKARINKARD